MIKYCRNCGNELADPNEKTCPGCSSNAVKATAFCRYCGKPTTVEDTVCPNCGASLRPVSNAVRLQNPDHVKLMKLGKIINLTIVVVVVVLYAVFALPKSIRKPAVQAASDAVMASTGYTALPLSYIEPSPAIIPELYTYYFYYTPPGMTVNSTRTFKIYAIYKNADTENATKAIRAVDVTDNCTYMSTNESVIIVTAPGLIKAIGGGAANVTAFYTAPPGSANMSNAAAGKTAVTFNTTVIVFVKNY